MFSTSVNSISETHFVPTFLDVPFIQLQYRAFRVRKELTTFNFLNSFLQSVTVQTFLFWTKTQLSSAVFLYAPIHCQALNMYAVPFWRTSEEILDNFQTVSHVTQTTPNKLIEICLRGWGQDGIIYSNIRIISTSNAKLCEYLSTSFSRQFNSHDLQKSIC